ncbi:MAG: type II secretion system protein, partial [Burkholderiales bacterium]
MSSGRQRGFTYLAALFFVAVAGLGLAVTGELWSHARQREKETELAWVGQQFRQAIGLYYQRSPGAVKRYPERLEDLLEDKRYLTVQRYLRRVYADPITGKADWGLVPAPGGGIMG